MYLRMSSFNNENEKSKVGWVRGKVGYSGLTDETASPLGRCRLHLTRKGHTGGILGATRPEQVLKPDGGAQTI